MLALGAACFGQENIPSGSAARFSNAAQYEGKTVSVSGKIQLYKGKPEIIVNSPSQITMK
jgi:DNA/RNA endonuclease YhcR with UshA esterase domain